MAAHTIWQARAMLPASGDYLELSEFHLYDGAARVDTAAVLTYTSDAAISGAIGNLKDDNTATGCAWLNSADSVVLTWTFAAPQAVTGIVLGARTTAAWFPIALVLVGYTKGADDVLRPGTALGFGGLRFASAAKTAVLEPAPEIGRIEPTLRTVLDHNAHSSFAGRVPFTVEREVLPRTSPPSYVPQFARVRLERDIDGFVVAEQWSDPVTGAGVFENIDANATYTLTAIYPDSGMRAVIADRIKPEGYPEVLP